MFAKYIFYVALSLQCAFIFTQDETSTCVLKETCQECLRDASVCKFCSVDNATEHKRCQPQDSDMSWCPHHEIQNPNNYLNESLTEDFVSAQDHIIQIKPQKLTLKLRPGLEKPFNFSFQAAKDFPVDLYFLIDASTSMKRTRERLADLSNDIYNYFREKTNNVYIGLGTFVDKRLFPMTNTFDSLRTYSFRHHFTLRNDSKEFEKILTGLPVGSNRDPQEGGLDALAQAIVCTKLIGWRYESRKIIVYLSNAPYHAAGHGKTAGLFHPYDGECYTDAVSYTKEQEMEYPSVPMIDYLAAKFDVNIFFLVHADVATVYKKFSSAVRGSAWAKFNGRDGILNSLKEIDKKKTNKIKLNIIMNSVVNRNNFEISIKPDCTKDFSDNTCATEIGVTKEFMASIKLKHYSDDLDKAVININVEGSSTRLTLDIEVIKHCDCEKLATETSEYCHSEKRICGVCHCSEKRYGENCMCTNDGYNKAASGNSTEVTCTPPGGHKLCSGYGGCFCGKCVCDKGYTGKYCECITADCPKGFNQQVCSGKGECQCNKKCKCKPEWTGDACDCTDSKQNCIAADGSVCNNRGDCKCGKCTSCHTFDSWDARNKVDEYCNTLPCTHDCHSLQCQKLEKCAICLHQETYDCSSDCDLHINATVVDTVGTEHLNSTWKLCPEYTVSMGCSSSFVYRYMEYEYGLEMVVQKEENCTEIAIIFGCVILLTLLLVGLATLLAWKMITTYRDRKEYQRFCRQNGIDDDIAENVNPLYIAPMTTTDNPSFRKRSFRKKSFS